MQVARDALFITCGWGHAFMAHPLRDGAPKFRVSVAREPRGFAIAGDHAVLSHGLGSVISTVSLTDATVDGERSLGWRDLALPERFRGRV